MITPQILALYLNCQIQITTESATFNKKMVGIYFDSWFNQKEELTIQAEIGDRVVAYKANQCKLILRPLSSMSEEEAAGLIKFDSIRHDEIQIMEIEKDKVWYIDGECWIGDGVSEIMDKNIYFNQLQAEQFKYLLSKHFDLFGLIESGDAIDSSKL